MNKEFEQLNAKFNDETYPVFPFVSKNKITLLKAGLYKKHKANFRGVTALFNKLTGEYEFPLFGMYHVPEDIVIVPDEVEMTENKKAFLKVALEAGYKQTNRPPKFETIKFPASSNEAKLALANKVDFQFTQATFGDIDQMEENDLLYNEQEA